MTNQKVLMTGAAGYVGTLLLDRLAPRYDWLLTDLHAPVRDYQLPFVAADINDLTAMTQLCRRVETVLHLAASARQDHDWENILSANLSGVRQVFEAARLAGCRRVVFASTLTLLDGVLENQDAGRRLTPDAPLAPGTLYAASKAWGEALAQTYARQYGMSLLCLRLGWIKPRDAKCLTPDWPHLGKVLIEGDCARLAAAAIDAPGDLRWGIFYGLSANREQPVDISATIERLGYHPQDDAFALARRHPWRQRTRRWAGRVWRAATQF